MMAGLPGSCDELMVTWTVPVNNGGLPVKYKLFLNEDEIDPLIFGNSTDQVMGYLTISLKALTADTEYTVTVVSFNELGDGGNVTRTGRTRPEGLGIYCHVLYSNSGNFYQ